MKNLVSSLQEQGGFLKIHTVSEYKSLYYKSALYARAQSKKYKGKV